MTSIKFIWLWWGFSSSSWKRMNIEEWRRAVNSLRLNQADFESGCHQVKKESSKRLEQRFNDSWRHWGQREGKWLFKMSKCESMTIKGVDETRWWFFCTNLHHLSNKCCSVVYDFGLWHPSHKFHYLLRSWAIARGSSKGGRRLRRWVRRSNNRRWLFYVCSAYFWLFIVIIIMTRSSSSAAASSAPHPHRSHQKRVKSKIMISDERSSRFCKSFSMRGREDCILWIFLECSRKTESRQTDRQQKWTVGESRRMRSKEGGKNRHDARWWSSSPLFSPSLSCNPDASDHNKRR